MEGYAYVQRWSMVDILLCSGDQWWIYSCAVVVNSGYAQVQRWSIEGYAHVQDWSMIDRLMCSGGQ